MPEEQVQFTKRVWHTLDPHMCKGGASLPVRARCLLSLVEWFAQTTGELCARTFVSAQGRAGRANTALGLKRGNKDAGTLCDTRCT